MDERPQLTVLAVDDEPLNLYVYEQVLAVHGHRLVKATSANQALELLQTQAFDAVIMDIHMPGMTGLDVVKSLRMSQGPNREVRVIAVTADTSAGRTPHYKARGFDDYVPKPVEVGALLDTLGRRASLEDRMNRRDVLREWVRESIEAN
jgi:CheY-like chemotaxis protein